ncbi:hypothetical protein M422DRAFT_64465 [Sphaerobolus stellatus SS14]|nr:hypothetical protein M422DRAFT_64465 [Sphaerobolus stellatus SS14]
MAAGLSGLRNRNARVTNKTLLRVIKGNLEADPLILDEEEDEKNRILASQGVDEEDANEHHLQAALSAHAHRSLTVRTEAEKTAFIPTPDAAGIVDNYDDLYPRHRYKDPATHIRFTDSIDESCIGGLSGSFTYLIDERDAEWLSRYNSAVKGEGTSSGNSFSNGTTVKAPRTTSSRQNKGKGKESEQSISQPSVEIDEDVFELVMGLFEKWTDEQISPYLHLAPDPEHFPDFSEYHKFLSNPLPLSTFASFQLPPYVPPPDKLTQIAKAIYPWWRERRIERKGQRIEPQLHVLFLEAQEKEDRAGSSPYTCFRKRDAKPMRKTRTNNVTHTEKLTRLRTELVGGLELAQMVLEREKLKREAAQVSQTIWHNREGLAEYMKQLNATAPGSIPPMDEHLLFDKERKPRKRPETAAGRIILAPARRHMRPDSVDPHSPLSVTGDMYHNFEEGQKWPTLRYQSIQKDIDKELTRGRKEDVFWEDNVDLPYVTPPLSTADKHFKVPLLDSTAATQATLKPDGDHPARSRPPRAPQALRLRVGRGGRKYVDRIGRTPRQHRLLEREWANHPLRKEELAESQQDTERWAFRDWHPPDSQRFHARPQRRLGELYLNHPSVYDVPADVTPTSEFDETGFGFAQDTLATEPRQVWLLNRASREDEAWKPTPHLAVDLDTADPEEAARNAAERDRIVEAWRGNTASATAGGALALFTDGTPGGEGENGQLMESPDSDNWSRPESRTDSLEYAWRMEERWRHDAEGRNTSGQDGEERYILDNYQSKYLRTNITLLDDHDHEALAVDPQLIPPLPSKPDRYLDHRLRLQHQALPPLSSALLPSSIPYRQIPVTTPVSSQASIPLSVAAQSRPVAADASVSHNIPSSSTLNNAQTGPASGGPPVQSTSSPKPNGVHVNGGARLPPDSGPVIRGNTPMRTKQAANGMPLPYQIPGSTEGAGTSGDIQMNGAASTAQTKGYPVLKSMLGNQASQAYSIGQPLPVPTVNGAANGTGVSGINHTNLAASSGMTNFPLKMPAAQKTVRLNGETHVANASVNGQNKDSQSTQPLTIPQLPTSGASAA